MYYLLGHPSSHHPCRWMDDEPFFKGINFQLGRKINKDVPIPLEYELEALDPLATDHGPEMPAVFLEAMPLFSDDFIAALLECGVNNFETFPAEIRDPDDGQIYTNYKAVNILGLVKAADLEKSNATVHDGVPLFDVDFDGLVLDEDKTHGFELFRLAEASTSILIHERVKSFLIQKGFTHVCFGDLATSAL